MSIHWCLVLFLIRDYNADLAYDMTFSHCKQRHKPLAFLSGRFNQTQQCWCTLVKGAYSVTATLERIHWLITSPYVFDLFTDHNNIAFSFHPLKMCPSLSKTSLWKVLDWAVPLSLYTFSCYHAKGCNKVRADLRGRCSAPHSSTTFPNSHPTLFRF